MLVIRKQQMQVFRRYALEQSVGIFAARLRKSFPERAAAIAELNAFIESGMAKAQKLGFQQRDNIGRFLEYLLVYGPDFPDVPGWAKAVFALKGIHETVRMDLLDSQEIFGAGNGSRGNKASK
jgi:hypothetical protein